MAIHTILVTGANGQLGWELGQLAASYPQYEFIFTDRSVIDLSKPDTLAAIINEMAPDAIINTAAYTAVDKAESDTEKAYTINVTGVANIAKACQQNHTVLLHISTDFVFDGTKTSPYTEDDIPNPLGVYGQTKLDGEKAIQTTWQKHFIIRTSWVYSQFGNNFMKTMLRLASERESLSVVNDQIGTPTNAVDLAEVLIKLIQSSNHSSSFGIYNFSNEGVCSWYDFAKEIFRINNISINLQPIPSSAYPTPAQRPAYSVLDKSKIKSVFGVEIKDWKESLSSVKL